MSTTRTPARSSGPPARPAKAGRSPRASRAASILALQRAAGNTTALALLRRANQVAEERSITLTLPGALDDAAVSSLTMGPNDPKNGPASVDIIRPTDANSVRLMQAAQTGWPDDATGTLVMRRRTPRGWVHQLTVTMERCTVASYVQGDDGNEWVGFHFRRAHIDHEGG